MKVNGKEGTCKAYKNCLTASYLVQHDIDICGMDENYDYIVCCDLPDKFQKAIESK